ncbi:MAG: hypothetical protein KGJ06_09845 [Pseudomonadota bacterium]|nr:hypothetical protein [Pseudomonadota bacterium]
MRKEMESFINPEKVAIKATSVFGSPQSNHFNPTLKAEEIKARAALDTALSFDNSLSRM